MAKCYIACDVEDYHPHVETIKTSLTEKGHEVVDTDTSNDEDVYHIEICRDDIIVTGRTKAILNSLSNSIKMGDGLYLTRRPEDVESIEKGIERVCESLNKTLL